MILLIIPTKDENNFLKLIKMNDQFVNLAKINLDIKNQLDLWKASEEFKIPYPKMEFYLKFLIIQNIRSILNRTGRIQNESRSQRNNSANSQLFTDSATFARSV